MLSTGYTALTFVQKQTRALTTLEINLDMNLIVKNVSKKT